MRDMKNGMESQQSQLEHALLMEPSISDGQCKPTSFPVLFPRLRWFKTEIVSDLRNCFRFMAILDLDIEACGCSWKGEVGRASEMFWQLCSFNLWGHNLEAVLRNQTGPQEKHPVNLYLEESCSQSLEPGKLQHAQEGSFKQESKGLKDNSTSSDWLACVHKHLIIIILYCLHMYFPNRKEISCYM